MRARSIIDSILPYGYWIDRHGKAWPVKEWGDHMEVAKHILDVNGYDDELGGEMPYSYFAQTKLGLVRVAIGSGDVVGDTIPVVSWERLPRAQRQALVDIATDRGKPIVFNEKPVD